MSKMVGGDFIIEHTPPAKCDLCGKVAELRPYGPNGENICVECGRRDPKGTSERLLKVLPRQIESSGTPMEVLIERTDFG